MLKKIALIFLITICLIVPCYAALETDFQAPSEFEKSDNWNSAVYDIYDLKTDENIQLYISNYTDVDYDLFFKSDSETNYVVSTLEDNIVLGKDGELNQGYVLEIIEDEGNKYIVYILSMKNPTDNQIKDTAKYLEEFNQLNSVEPIEV